MLIAGLQKFTLLDYPGKTACTIFLAGCNFKCRFCHNPELLKAPDREFTQKEILEFLEKRKGQLDAVCITGGEPLLSLNYDFVKKIKELGYLVKIDTNGTSPEKIKELINLNLVDYIAMDLKSSPQTYSKITQSNIDLEKIKESIKVIVNFGNYEFRTTYLPELHQDIEYLWKFAVETAEKKPKLYFLQAFRNRGKLVDDRLVKDTTEEDLLKIKPLAEKYFEVVKIRS